MTSLGNGEWGRATGRSDWGNQSQISNRTISGYRIFSRISDGNKIPYKLEYNGVIVAQCDTAKGDNFTKADFDFMIESKLGQNLDCTKTEEDDGVSVREITGNPAPGGNFDEDGNLIPCLSPIRKARKSEVNSPKKNVTFSVDKISQKIIKDIELIGRVNHELKKYPYKKDVETSNSRQNTDKSYYENLSIELKKYSDRKDQEDSQQKADKSH